MKNTKSPREYVALALDNVRTKEEIMALVSQTAEYVGTCKIGLEQFVRFGPEIVDVIKHKDCALFLDLKFHDIPNTVAKAVSAACDHGVDYLTLHTSGGVEMMRAAAEAACSGDAKVKLLGVTVLTSIDEVMLNNELKVCAALQEQVAHLAGCAVEAEMDGIVCGAKDLAYIRTQLPERFEIVTPGIRLDPQESHDQKRVATPAGAIKHGATLLVLGRAITSHEDPARAAARVCHSIAEAL